jgi:hypothetical protein
MMMKYQRASKFFFFLSLKLLSYLLILFDLLFHLGHFLFFINIWSSISSCIRALYSIWNMLLVRNLRPMMLVITYLRSMKEVGSTVAATQTVQSLTQSQWLIRVIYWACRIISSRTIQSTN